MKVYEHEYPFAGSQDNTLYSPQINYDIENAIHDIGWENYDAKGMHQWPCKEMSGPTLRG